MQKIGFIGGGNMASAIYRGILNNALTAPKDIVVYDIDADKLQSTAAELGITAATSNGEVVQSCAIIFIAVKPQFTQGVLDEIKPLITKENAFISIVAGWSNERLLAALGPNGRVLRVMPNTPLMVGEGMSCLCAEHGLTADEFTYVKSVFDHLGRTEILPEKQIAAFSGLAGSSPAYAFMMIEAMADAGCLLGLPRDISYRVSAQALLGSGKMVLESGSHPAALKDAVCSPGGTTIEAVFALEQGGFRAALIDAIVRCTDKFNKL